LRRSTCGGEERRVNLSLREGHGLDTGQATGLGQELLHKREQEAAFPFGARLISKMEVRKNRVTLSRWKAFRLAEEKVQ